MLRVPRWLRYVGFAILSVSLTSMGVVFGVQTANRPVCLSLVDNNSRRLAIYDPSHARILPETRYASPIYWLSSEDYRFMTQPHLDNADVYSLVLLPADGEPIVLEEALQETQSGGFSPRASWSPDRSLLAYIWRDAERNTYLTIFNIEDHSRQTAPLRREASRVDNLWLAAWSPDGAYIDIRAMGNQPFLDFYGLWSVEDMTLLTLDFENTIINTISMWSPVGHQLAAVVQPLGDVDPELHIIDPDDPDNRIRVALNLSSEFVERVYAVSWSPDSAYITIVKQRSLRVNEGRTFVRQWFYDLYRNDGTPLESDIAGKSLHSSSATASRPTVPAFWIPGENSWLFLQDTFEGAVPTTHLMTYTPETGATDMLEDRVVSAYYEQMFQSPSFYSLGSVISASEAVIPENRHFLLPYWQDETIKLDYIDYEHDARFTLIEGAQEVLLDFSIVTFSSLYSADEGFFALPWRLDSRGNTETRLTVLRSDNGEILMEVTGMEDIGQVNWISIDWISVVALRDGVWGVELLNVETGLHHRRLIEGPDAESGIYGSLSPDGQQMALVITPRRTYTGSERGQLYLVSLESGEVQLIYEEAVPFGSWSPDSSSLAFMRPGVHNRLGVQVVSATGDTIGVADIPIELGSSMRSIYMWSQCEANPLPE